MTGVAVAATSRAPHAPIAWIRSNPLAFLGATVLAAVLIAGVAAPFTGYDPISDVDASRVHLPPGPDAWLGTDHLGRNVAWRLLFACRSFALPGLLACGIAVLVGVPAGAAAGWYGGGVETALRYAFTVVQSVPRFVLVLLALSIYGDSTWLLALVAGCVFAPALGEAVFARIEALRSADYVLANLAYGLPSWRVLWVHLVWAACRRLVGRHVLGLFGYFLVLETTLSYIGGFGVQEPTPSWGNMLVFEWGRTAWHAPNLLAPAIAIWLTVASTHWLSDALAEKADA